jgi:hypothetical protein
MRTRLDILAVIMALAGHLVGVIGLPLPKSPVESASAPIKADGKRKCCCACGDGCGPCCCCSGESRPAAPPSDAETEWHWVASVQMQKCFGFSPLGIADLPPGLPVEWSVNHVYLDPIVENVPIAPITTVAVSFRPPIPPPRAV